MEAMTKYKYKPKVYNKKEPKFKVGDSIKNSKGWSRLIIEVVKDYLGTKNRFGYRYMDDWGFIFGNLCSEEHLSEWKGR